MSLDPVFGNLLLASFVLLFGSAALHKWRNLSRFDRVFAAYDVLPQLASWRVSWLVPLLETAVALGLLPGVTRLYACGAGAVLLLGYVGAIAWNLRRGRLDIACGCGGPDQHRPIAGWMVWRNLLLALLLGAALLPRSGRALQPTDWATIGFGAAAVAVAYLCIDRLGQVARQSRVLRGTR